MNEYSEESYHPEMSEVERASVADVFRVMFRPSTVFPRLIRTGHAWPWAFFLISVAAMLSLLIGLDTIQADMQENLPTTLGSDIDPRALAVFMVIVSLIAIPVSYLISIVFAAGAFMFFGNFVLGGKARFKQVLNVTAFSMAPLIIGHLISALVYMITGSLDFRMGLDMLVNESMRTSFIGIWLGIFNFFYIWEIILLVIGLSTLYGFSRGKTAAWLISLLLTWHTFIAMIMSFAADFTSSMHAPF